MQEVIVHGQLTMLLCCDFNFSCHERLTFGFKNLSMILLIMMKNVNRSEKATIQINWTELKEIDSIFIPLLLLPFHLKNVLFFQ